MVVSKKNVFAMWKMGRRWAEEGKGEGIVRYPTEMKESCCIYSNASLLSESNQMKNNEIVENFLLCHSNAFLENNK